MCAKETMSLIQYSSYFDVTLVENIVTLLASCISKLSLHPCLSTLLPEQTFFFPFYFCPYLIFSPAIISQSVSYLYLLYILFCLIIVVRITRKAGNLLSK